VHLAVGSAPRVARFYRGRDVVAWLDEIGYYRKGIDQFDDVDAVRFRVNHYVTGRDGGRTSTCARSRGRNAVARQASVL